MMQHENLGKGAWAEMPLAQQMANIGSESFRATKWLMKGRADNADRAFERMQELVDLSIAFCRRNTPNRMAFLKEICRFRELFCEAYLSADLDELNALNSYLDQFAKVKK
ncbi:MAG: hypothetical protein IKU03_03185 [Bacteroidales bacterium]|nr:hypothetical protein [Bacteroidales bacterium]